MKKRLFWISKRLPFMCEIPHRLVCIVLEARLRLGETSTNTKMTRLRGRAPRSVPFGHWQTQTFIAVVRCNGLTAPWVFDGAINSAVFDKYIETQLAPTLTAGTAYVILFAVSSG